MKNQGLEKYFSIDQIKKKTGITVNERFVNELSRLHWHDFLELELVLSGSGEQILNGQKTELKRGCLSVIRLTDFHQVTPKNNLRLINLMVDDKILTEEMLTKITSENILFFNLNEGQSHAFEMLLRLCIRHILCACSKTASLNISPIFLMNFTVICVILFFTRVCLLSVLVVQPY